VVHPQPRRAFALTALVALLSPPAVGLALAIHLLSDHHHEGASPDNAGVEIALHGHAHIEGTPPHGHPIVGSAATPLPGRILVPPAALVGDAPEVILGDPLGRRGLWGDDPTRDPPPRRMAPPILRI
jgi:hypothetical protein